MTPETEKSIANAKNNWAQEARTRTWPANEISWGDPSRCDDPLGNYSALAGILEKAADSDKGKDIVEIGSMAGKWIEHLAIHNNITCVDIIEESFDIIRSRYPEYRMEFYLTKGNELKGIKNDTQDLVFSIDSLMRTPSEAIWDYIEESYRVLRKGGQILFHLPCRLMPMCEEKGFTHLHLADIESHILFYGFKTFKIDMQTLNHGIIVEAWK